MFDVQLVGGLVIIGILIFSTITHGIVYLRMRNYRVDGIFSLLCVLVAAYTSTNMAALYSIPDVANYLFVNKLSSVAVILIIPTMAWFSSEFLQDYKNIPVKLIALTFTPFFALNLFMENGILWSSLEGVQSTPRLLGSNITRPVNAVVSWPMYGLWFVIAMTYLILVRAAYVSMKFRHRQRGVVLFTILVALSAAFAFDMSIDLGINKSYFYISEYVIIAFVVLMSLHLSDELRMNSLNLESVVAERTKALEQANKELKTFSYSVSHDLRAPLRSIHGFLSVIQQDYAKSLNPDAQELIKRACSNAKRMQSMIDGLLELSSISHRELVRKDVDLSQLALEIIQELKEREPERNVSIEIEPDLRCQCDPSLMRILLENLLGNAWKYTSREESPEIIFKSFKSDPGHMGFLIRDNGAGFEKQYADKLFLPFQRLHSIEDFPGIGIGLATVERIVNRHGGKIWAESQTNQGATFFFEL